MRASAIVAGAIIVAGIYLAIAATAAVSTTWTALGVLAIALVASIVIVASSALAAQAFARLTTSRRPFGVTHTRAHAPNGRGHAVCHALYEGSSLPALVEADDGAEYVVKPGAGHGEKALVAELIVGEIGRLLGLPVPEIVLAVLPESIAGPSRTTRSATSSAGRSGSTWVWRSSRGVGADLTRTLPEGPDWAVDVVWFDDLTINRTDAAHANLIVAHGRSWLIDHGRRSTSTTPGPIPTPMPAARSSASSITSSCPSPAQSARQMRGWRRASRATRWTRSSTPSRTSGGQRRLGGPA